MSGWNGWNSYERPGGLEAAKHRIMVEVPSATFHTTATRIGITLSLSVRAKPGAPSYILLDVGNGTFRRPRSNSPERVIAWLKQDLGQ